MRKEQRSYIQARFFAQKFSFTVSRETRTPKQRNDRHEPLLARGFFRPLTGALADDFAESLPSARVFRTQTRPCHHYHEPKMPKIFDECAEKRNPLEDRFAPSSTVCAFAPFQPVAVKMTFPERKSQLLFGPTDFSQT